jgi:hypothetical protein
VAEADFPHLRAASPAAHVGRGALGLTDHGARSTSTLAEGDGVEAVDFTEGEHSDEKDRVMSLANPQALVLLRTYGLIMGLLGLSH